MSNKKLLQLLKHDPSLQIVTEQTLSSLQLLFRWNSKQVTAFQEDYERITDKKIDQYLKENKIDVMTIFDTNYPLLLKEIYDPPVVMYTIGNQALLQTNMLAVVGSREMTSLGRSSIDTLLPELIEKQWTIVSGIAAGVDTYAHQAAIQNQGNTIAVLGSGVLHVYPKSNRKLYETMKKEQLIVSEYPPHKRPQKWQFPERNRIISGLSYGVLVIEAKEKSGSLITADQALEQGREVFATPGPIYTKSSSGTNYLIQQGAKMVTQAKDIWEEWT